MLRTVRDCCEPYAKTLAYSSQDQIEDLVESINSETDDGSAFFERTFITKGMADVFRMGLKRLSGQHDDGLFVLSQAMGGGKTHLLIAMALLARHADLRRRVLVEAGIGQIADFGSARIAAISGRQRYEHFIWGEIASQIGRAEQIKPFWENGPRAPGENDWAKIIGRQPTLILLDELAPYLDNAATVSVGDGTLATVTTNAISNLLEAARKLPNCCIIMSALNGSYENASRNIERILHNLKQESQRGAVPITPVNLGGGEIYEILKKRLFKRLPGPDVVADVAAAYARSMEEAVKGKVVSKSAEQMVDEIHASYPFHPALKDVIALFKENESFRQTRGLMAFTARLVRSVWNRDTNDVYLIGAQHLDLNDSEVREEVRRISELDGAIAKDIADDGHAVAETVDGQMSSDAGSQVANIILCASLARGVDAKKGLTEARIVECLVAPNRTPLEFTEALAGLRQECWYLHAKDDGVFYFANQENLTKRLVSEASRAPQGKVDQEMRRLLLEIFAPVKKVAYQEALALPEIDQIDVSRRDKRVLLILEPDSKQPPKFLDDFYQNVTNKNNFLAITGSGSDLLKIENIVREIYAIDRVRRADNMHDSLVVELDEKDRNARIAFNGAIRSAYNNLYYPTRNGLIRAAIEVNFTGEAGSGEAVIEAKLAGADCKKLKLEIEPELDMLIDRAEEMLWPGGQKRLPWADVAGRSVSNPAWLWLPPKSLEEIRDAACGRGKWRLDSTNYIEKGPFEKPRTSVSATSAEDDFDEETGEAVVRVLAIDAGPRPEILWSETPDVERTGKTLEGSAITTRAFELWFLAKDITKQHETGEAVRWQNRIGIRHQPSGAPGAREVSLAVVPAGAEVRYTIDGSTPRDGRAYEGPFRIPDEALTLRVWAGAQGVEAEKVFRIGAAVSGETGFCLDEARPAKLELNRKEVMTSADEVWGFVRAAKETRAKVQVREVMVGTGESQAIVALPTIAIAMEDLEKLIADLRKAIGQPDAPVFLKAAEVEFAAGQDLIAFAKARGIEIDGAKVTQ